MRRFVAPALCAVALQRPYRLPSRDSGPDVAGEAAVDGQRQLDKAASRGRPQRREAPRRREARGRAAPRRAVPVPPQLEAIAQCESGGDPTRRQLDGMYHGKYQFTMGPGPRVGGTGCPAGPRGRAGHARGDALRAVRPGPVARLRRVLEGSSGADHLRARHDVVLAGVGPADPRLVAAVVVRRPEHEGRVALPDRAGVRALGVEAAPDADEGVLLPLLADGRGVGVARVQPVAGGSFISTSMIEVLRSS